MVLTQMHGAENLKDLSESQLHQLESHLMTDIAREVLTQKPLFDKLAEQSKQRLAVVKQG
jgi:hypothetical protein